MLERRTGKIAPPKRSTVAESDFPIELPSPLQKVWRFMSFEKFADLIKSQSLYCSRLDKLPDALEGLLSAGNCRAMSPVTAAFHNGYDIKDNCDRQLLQSAHMRRLYFVNCWHINDSESKTMWRLYAPRPESVVVVSNVSRLWAYAKICRHKRFGHMIVGNVKYASFDDPRPDWVSWLPALFKDLPYRIEREIRLLASPNCSMEQAANLDFLKIRLDPRALIEAVILHPHAYPGFCRAVRELARELLPHVPVATSKIKSRLW
jgi:hypothetical protein